MQLHVSLAAQHHFHCQAPATQQLIGTVNADYHGLPEGLLSMCNHSANALLSAQVPWQGQLQVLPLPPWMSSRPAS